jgi:hypothetical protein
MMAMKYILPVLIVAMLLSWYYFNSQLNSIKKKYLIPTIQKTMAIENKLSELEKKINVPKTEDNTIMLEMSYNTDNNNTNDNISEKVCNVQQNEKCNVQQNDIIIENNIFANLLKTFNNFENNKVECTYANLLTEFESSGIAMPIIEDLKEDDEDLKEDVE